MGSEETSKIFALIVVTLSYISVPVLLFIFVVAVYFDLRYVVQFYYSKAIADALTAILLALVNVALFFGIRALIRWLRQ